MAIEFTIYDPSTGKILRSGNTSGDSVLHKVQAGEAVLTGEARDAADFYVASGAITQRPEADMSSLAGTITAGDTRTLTGLPAGAMASVTNTEGSEASEAADVNGDVVIEFDDPGHFTVTITGPFPFKPTSTTVTVADGA